MSDSWDPEQYHRFRTERARPFHDLLDLLQPFPTAPLSGGPRLLDLGCGTGELTALAHHHLGAAATLGVDSSAAMLASAEEHSTDTIRFVMGDLARIDRLDRELPLAAVGDQRVFGSPGWDAIVANASLQWVPDHDAVLSAWRQHLRPGGQLAVQVPANHHHPSHTTIAEVAAEEPFRTALAAGPPPEPMDHVHPPEAYAEVLWRLGATEQVVRLQVYGMELASWADVVEWTSGTALVRVRRLLDPELYEQFVARYRERLGDHLGHREPYYYAFTRILMWARFD